MNFSDNVILPTEETRIEYGSAVLLHFSVALENGVQIDNSRTGRDEPVALQVGDGNLLEGFEKVLIGLRAGDRRTATLPPEEAFGIWNPENVQSFDIRAFQDVPAVGMVMEFEDKSKSTLAGVVKAVTTEGVEVDFNHPLAGQSLMFEVEIFKVTPQGQTGIQIQ